MDLMKEFLNCERFVVEEGDDTFSFDVGAVVGNCFVGINRGFNSRSFHLSEDVSLWRVDGNCLCLESGDIIITAFFEAERSIDTTSYGRIISLSHMRTSEIVMLMSSICCNPDDVHMPVLCALENGSEKMITLLDGDCVIACVPIPADVAKYLRPTFEFYT